MYQILYLIQTFYKVGKSADDFQHSSKFENDFSFVSKSKRIFKRFKSMLIEKSRFDTWFVVFSHYLFFHCCFFPQADAYFQVRTLVFFSRYFPLFFLVLCSLRFY